MSLACLSWNQWNDYRSWDSQKLFATDQTAKHLMTSKVNTCALQLPKPEWHSNIILWQWPAFTWTCAHTNRCGIKYTRRRFCILRNRATQHHVVGVWICPSARTRRFDPTGGARRHGHLLYEGSPRTYLLKRASLLTYPLQFIVDDHRLRHAIIWMRIMQGTTYHETSGYSGRYPMVGIGAFGTGIWYNNIWGNRSILWRCHVWIRKRYFGFWSGYFWT